MKSLPIHFACLSGNKNALRKIISSVSQRALEIKDSFGRTPLILTVIYNHLECGILLLKAGVHVDISDNAGQTALHIATSKGFHAFVKLLLSYKASWMQGDYFGVTALHMAAIHPNLKCLSVILKYVKPGQTDIQDSTLKTALHWSAAYTYNDHIKLLLGEGANICIPDGEGKTPLHWAASNTSPEALECVKTLLKNEANLINWQDYQGRCALHISVVSGSTEVLYYLASHEDCNIDALDNSFCTPLHWAAKAGLTEKADILLKKRANHSSADDNGARPLHYASYNNYIETVVAFLSRHYIYDEADKLGRNAFFWAASKNAVEVLKVFITSDSSPLWADKNGFTAMHAAVIQGHVTVIETLVTLGVPVDIPDKNGMTPFLKSCEIGSSKIAQLLLDLGANIHACDINLSSAMHWCAKSGHAYITQILIKRGANCNVQDSLGMTPLHCASISGDYVNCISVLLESNAFPNIADFEGKTPLHHAVLNERKGAVQLLSQYASDINTMFVMDDWVTALDCAMLTHNKELVNLLQKYGALSVREIKEFAAGIIQAWLRKRRKTKTHLYKLPKLNPTYIFPKKTDTMENLNRCMSPSKVCFEIKQGSILYHECNGCFHKVLCQHVCSKNNKDCNISSVKQNAAFVIQRAIRKYCMKKRFCKIRTEVIKAFYTEEERILAEKQWQLRLKSFYSEIEN